MLGTLYGSPDRKLSNSNSNSNSNSKSNSKSVMPVDDAVWTVAC